MSTTSWVLLAAVAAGAYYLYSQSNAANQVQTTAPSTAGAATAPGSGLVNQAAAAAAGYVNSQLAGLIDNGGSSFGDPSQDS